MDLVDLLRAEFGSHFEDARARLNYDKDEFGYMDSRKCRYLVIHHSAGGHRIPVSPEGIAYFHDVTRKWWGVGYHFIVDEGRLYYVGSVDTMRAHIEKRNDEGLGICITGTYETLTPYPDDLDIVRRLVKVLDTFYGHKKEIAGHRTLMPPNHTTCPGDGLLAVLPTLRDPVPALDLAQLSNDLRWNAEQTMRDIQAGNTTVALARLDREVVPRAYALERHHKGK